MNRIKKLKNESETLRDACIWMTGLECLAPDKPGWEYFEKKIRPLLAPQTQPKETQND